MQKTKLQISCTVTMQLISAFVLATKIVQCIFFLNPKFQAFSHLWLYSMACVGPGPNPEDRFSHDGALIKHLYFIKKSLAYYELQILYICCKENKAFLIFYFQHYMLEITKYMYMSCMLKNDTVFDKVYTKYITISF